MERRKGLYFTLIALALCLASYTLYVQSAEPLEIKEAENLNLETMEIAGADGVVGQAPRPPPPPPVTTRAPKTKRPKVARNPGDPMDEHFDPAVQPYDIGAKCKADWLYKNEVGDWENWQLNPEDKYEGKDPKKLGALVVLASTKEEDIRDMHGLFAGIDKHFNDAYHYDIIVFHEPNYAQNLREDLRAHTRSNLIFLEMAWCIPHWVQGYPLAPVSNGGSIGYRQMERLYAGKMVQHPVMAQYRFYWRLDADSRLLSKVDFDVFKYAEEHNILYGFNMVWFDQPFYLGNVWPVTQQFFEQIKNPDSEVNKRVHWEVATKGPEAVAEWERTRLTPLVLTNGNYNGVLFFNNFEVLDVQYFRKPLYQSFFDHIDHSELIYSLRLGDHIIHTLFVLSFVKDEQIHYFKEIGYSHDINRFWCPAGKESEELCEIPGSLRAIHHNPCSSDVNSPVCSRQWH